MDYIAIILISIFTINLATFIRACEGRRNVGEYSTVEEYGYLLHGMNLVGLFVGKFGFWLGYKMIRNSRR